MTDAEINKARQRCIPKQKLSRGYAQIKARELQMDYYQCPICGKWHLTKRKPFKPDFRPKMTNAELLEAVKPLIKSYFGDVPITEETTVIDCVLALPEVEQVKAYNRFVSDMPFHCRPTKTLLRIAVKLRSKYLIS